MSCTYIYLCIYIYIYIYIYTHSRTGKINKCIIYVHSHTQSRRDIFKKNPKTHVYQSCQSMFHLHVGIKYIYTQTNREGSVQKINTHVFGCCQRICHVLLPELVVYMLAACLHVLRYVCMCECVYVCMHVCITHGLHARSAPACIVTWKCVQAANLAMIIIVHLVNKSAVKVWKKKII